MNCHGHFLCLHLFSFLGYERKINGDAENAQCQLDCTANMYCNAHSKCTKVKTFSEHNGGQDPPSPVVYAKCLHFSTFPECFAVHIFSAAKLARAFSVSPFIFLSGQISAEWVSVTKRRRKSQNFEVSPEESGFASRRVLYASPRHLDQDFLGKPAHFWGHTGSKDRCAG